MKFSSSVMVLATLTTGQALASSIMPKHNHAARHVEKMRMHDEQRHAAKRDTSILEPRDMNAILKLGVISIPQNPTKANGGVWVNNDGPFTNQFFNNGTSDLALAVWGPWGSWVNRVPPQVVVSIPASKSVTLSFAPGYSGAWAPIYNDTQLVNGQISETWGEFTFGDWGVVDVSREVNMKGKNMRIVGPTCTTDMTTCVFKCQPGESVCTYNYLLENCAIGSQPGANYGMYGDSPSGGCGGMGSKAALKTYLNYK